MNLLTIRSVVVTFILIFLFYTVAVINSDQNNIVETATMPPITSKTSTYFNQTIPPPGVLLNPIGGTGNQLFGYACSYALARDKNWPIYLHVNDYNEISTTRQFQTGQREFALDQFQIPELNFYDKNSTVRNVHYVSESKFLERQFPELNSDGFIQLNGYAQSPEYWSRSNYQFELQKILQPSPHVQFSMSNEVKYILKEIQNTESVALHIRRGDFLNSGGNAFFLPISFQRNAIRRMLKILKSRNSPEPPVFFVFSDDINYLKDKFKDFEKDYKFVYVSDLQTTSIQDLYLMIQCKHIIFPNSTFSWWAAFLNFHKNKIVITTAFNPEFWKLWPNARDWARTQHGTLYHFSSWIVMDPFSGEQSSSPTWLSELITSENANNVNDSRYHNTLNVDYVNLNDGFNLVNTENAKNLALYERIISAERTYHHTTLANRNTASENANWNVADLMQFFPPSFKCPHSQSRVGSSDLEKNGKMICGLDLYETGPRPEECVVYMITDSPSDFEYLEELANRTNCHIFNFNLNGSLDSGNERIKSVNIGIDVEDRNDTVKTLRSIMKMNEHAWIDMLFLDIGGRELPVLEQIVKDFYEICPIGQLHIAIHVSPVSEESREYLGSRENFTKLFGSLEEKGFRPFHAEKNSLLIEEWEGNKIENVVVNYGFINVRGKHLLLTGKDNS